MPLLALCSSGCLGGNQDSEEIMVPADNPTGPTLLTSRGESTPAILGGISKARQSPSSGITEDEESAAHEEDPAAQEPSLVQTTTWQVSSGSGLPGGSQSALPSEVPRTQATSEPRSHATQATTEEVKNARAKQRDEARLAVRSFLEQNGFDSVKASRRRIMHTCYPLHVAVRANNVELIHKLLRAGADPFKTDSSGRTPLELAQKLNSSSSHRKAVEVLKRSTRNGKHWVPWLRTASGALAMQPTSEELAAPASSLGVSGASSSTTG